MTNESYTIIVVRVTAVVLYVFISLFLLSTENISAESVLKLNVVPKESYEKLKDKVPVAGTVIKGAFIKGQTRYPMLDQVLIDLPKADAQRLCLELKSSDAKYHSRRSYDLANTQPNLYRLPVETEHEKFINSLKLIELGSSAWLSNNCSSIRQKALEQPMKLLPVRWGDASPKVVTLQVNARTIETHVILTRGDQSTTHSCVSLPDDSGQVSFDTICDIPVNYDDCEVMLAVVRRSGSSVLPYSKVRLLIRSCK